MQELVPSATGLTKIVPMSVEDNSVNSLATRARQASFELSSASRALKDEALRAMADALESSMAEVLSANKIDVDQARETGTPEAMIDRLALDASRVAGMVGGLRKLVDLADPVGEIVRGWNLANGVQIKQVRVPFGVVGMIYEARPNVTADAAGVCLKSGNASILRGSSSALYSNRAIVKALRSGLEASGLPVDSVSLVEGGHETTQQMMAARGLIDVLIPRGGAGLINAVVENSKVPVIETGTGNCHLFVDRAANLDIAEKIILNAKVQRPSVCNALETLLVHQEVAEDFIPRITDSLMAKGVTLHGNDKAVSLDSRIIAARSDEFNAEYLSLDLAVKVVSDIDDAIEHIRTHTTGHSETIVTNDMVASNKFVSAIDTAAVLVNASSRFVDGGEFGFGAEIGISTQKLHARGPMALQEMTSTRYVITGEGQVRS